MNIAPINGPRAGLILISDLLMPGRPQEELLKDQRAAGLLFQLAAPLPGSFGGAFLTGRDGLELGTFDLRKSLRELFAELAASGQLLIEDFFASNPFKRSEPFLRDALRLGELAAPDPTRASIFLPVSFTSAAESAGTLLQLSRVSDSFGTRSAPAEFRFPGSAFVSLPKMFARSETKTAPRTASAHRLGARREPYERAATSAAAPPRPARAGRTLLPGSFLSKLLRGLRRLFERSPIRSK